jgi:hypothetical protein
MKRFGVDDALIGDVTEQSRQRSRVWFLQQALVATGGAVIAAARQTPIRTAVTAISSVVTLILWFGGTLWLYR